MNLNDLAEILSEMYENAEYEYKEAMIHLFGIRFALEIKEGGFNASKIIEHANKNREVIKPSCYSEINKGIKLAEFVIDKEKLRDIFISIL